MPSCTACRLCRSCCSCRGRRRAGWVFRAEQTAASSPATASSSDGPTSARCSASGDPRGGPHSPHQNRGGTRPPRCLTPSNSLMARRRWTDSRFALAGGVLEHLIVVVVVAAELSLMSPILSPRSSSLSLASSQVSSAFSFASPHDSWPCPSACLALPLTWSSFMAPPPRLVDSGNTPPYLQQTFGDAVTPSRLTAASLGKHWLTAPRFDDTLPQRGTQSCGETRIPNGSASARQTVSERNSVCRLRALGNPAAAALRVGG